MKNTDMCKSCSSCEADSVPCASTRGLINPDEDVLPRWECRRLCQALQAARVSCGRRQCKVELRTGLLLRRSTSAGIDNQHDPSVQAQVTDLTAPGGSEAISDG